MGPKIRSISDDRTYTEKYAELKTDEDLYMNKNVDWINSKGTKLGYLFIVAVVFLFLNATQLFQLHESWTVTNLAHMIVRTACSTLHKIIISFSFHFMSLHFTSLHFTSLHFTSLHFVIRCWDLPG